MSHIEFSPESGEAAHAALATLAIIRAHRIKCMQCRTDPAWCDTDRQYGKTFDAEFATWYRMSRVGAEA